MVEVACGIPRPGYLREERRRHCKMVFPHPRFGSHNHKRHVNPRNAAQCIFEAHQAQPNFYRQTLVDTADPDSSTPEYSVRERQRDHTARCWRHQHLFLVPQDYRQNHRGWCLFDRGKFSLQTISYHLDIFTIYKVLTKAMSKTHAPN